MNAKKLFGGLFGRHMMRRRHHRRIRRNLVMQARQFGKFRGLMLLGVGAAVAQYLRRRKARDAEHLPQAVEI